MSKNADSWETSDGECTNLADLETEAEVKFVQGYLADELSVSGGDNLWIGVKYHFEVGENWRWADSSGVIENFCES